VNVVHDLTSRGIGLKVLSGQGAAIDTTTPAGKLVFGIFASLAEFERDLIPWASLKRISAICAES
jgi:DNA invertase Pin-like site-specific DNA recombinase